MNRKTLFQKIMFLSISLTMVGAFFAPSVFKKASAAGIHDFSYDDQSITIDAKITGITPAEFILIGKKLF